MNHVFFLDVLLFLLFLHYVLFFKGGLLGVFCNFFLLFCEMFLVILVSVQWVIWFLFLLFLFCYFFCFFGYFSYSFCVCGMLEFTLVYSLVAWLATIFVLMSGVKFSVYLSKVGDSFLKTFSMLLVEVVSELSRPLALTIRLTVNVMVGHMIVGFLYILLEGLLGEGFVWFMIFAVMMECFVFFIQSYIFSRLIYLYLNE
uniref:ATP synthase subunit a n=1 Tax=Aelurostrongylus abstrusus TaxID=321389 RepID=K7QGZ1_AELAB|nr:ATP synthase F0 subunit 6 [Aelurostrongylus abstrusus]AFT65555.1 ATP synthase F0 subunit 6 [Aelurostrongylus abstrusus]